jgi:hypothetical protein
METAMKNVRINQLNKYCNLRENERVIIIDEKLIRKESLYKKSFWGCKNKNRVAKAMLMHWEREIDNYKYKIKREITTEDVVLLKQSMEAYQKIADSILCGFPTHTKIEKTDILEVLISDTESRFFEDIEFKKKGWIRDDKKFPFMSWLSDKHIVTIIECEKYLTIKEIYIPYNGIVIQLPI